MAKRYLRINWQNKPNTATPINAENLNKMDKGIDDIDNALETLLNSITDQIVNDKSKINNASVIYSLKQSLDTLNNKLAGKLLGNLTARFAIYDSLPTDDTPNGWITAYGRNAIIISDITNYNGYYGLMLTIIGSIGTEYVGQIIITGTGIKSRRSSSLSNWSNWV